MDSRLKQWVFGAAFPLLPIGYGVICLLRGSALILRQHRQYLEIDGVAGTYIAVAYIALGLSAHLYFFWYEPAEEPSWLHHSALAAVLLLFLFCLLRGLFLCAY